MKIALVALWAAAIALAILTCIVVFFPPGAPGPVTSPIAASLSPSATSIATSTATAGPVVGSSTTTGNATSTIIAMAPGEFASDYAAPYPATWQDGNEQFSVTGASFLGGNLTLTLAIQMGAAPDCVAANLRLVTDEAGTLRAPDAPAGGKFNFPDTQSCNGTPGAVYSASVSFNTTPVTPPFLLTSGSVPNTFFFVATTTAGGIDITPPPTQG